MTHLNFKRIHYLVFEQYGCRLLVAVIAAAGVTGHLHDLDELLEAMHKGLTVKI